MGAPMLPLTIERCNYALSCLVVFHVSFKFQFMFMLI